MGDQQLPTALHLVELPTVLDNVVEQAHNGLQQLASTLPGLPDEERKRALLRYLHASRQQLQRLHVVVHWSNKAKAVAEVKRLLEVAAHHGTSLRETADQLAFLWAELENGKAPLYDVPTAVHVLETGAYKLLPTSIEEQGGVPPRPASDAKRCAALRKMDFLLRSKLLASKLPEGMEVVHVRDGTAEVVVPGQYTAELTLVPAPRDDVTLVKYQPPVSEASMPPGPSVDVEVNQGAPAEAEAGSSAAEAAPMDLDAGPNSAGGTAGTAAAAAGGGEGGAQGGSGAPREADRWRWLLVSFKLLPAWDSETPAVAANQAAWLQRHLEDKMWRAADVQQLQRRGAASSLLVFPQAAQQAKQAPPQQQPAASQRPGSGAVSMLSAPPAGAGAGAVAADSAAAQVAAAAAAAAAAPTAAVGSKREVAEGEAGAEPAHPDWTACPLSLMHSVLRQAAGRLTVYSLILTEARRLEKGSWEGMLRISRSAGTGLRFTYWLGQPTLGHWELQALRGGSAGMGAAGGQQAALAAGPAAAAAAAPAGGAPVPPALEVNLEESGALVCVHSPPLYGPLSGLPVHLRLSPSSLSIEELLLAAAANNAATQLAAIQAVLEADQQWAALSISLQLLPPPASPVSTASAQPAALAPPSAAGAAGAVPALLFRAAGDASPFLALTVALKTARLVVASGPALLEAWGGTGVSQSSAGGAGEGASSSAHTALIAATQQRVERLQKDALTLPLAGAPSSVAALVKEGGSRGVLAAGLVASALAALCRRLVRQRRLAGVAAAAQKLGLLPSLPLPLLLLQDHLKQLPLPRAGGELASDALTLALPSFPAPADMVSWERRQRAARAAAWQASETIRQHRQRLKTVLPLVSGGQAGGAGAARLASAASISSQVSLVAAGAEAAARAGGGSGECGAVRAHLLVEYLDGSEDSSKEGAAAAQAASPAAKQPSGTESGGGGSGDATFRLSLVVSSCTSRGTVKQVLRVLPLPPHLITSSPVAAAAAAGAGAPSRTGSKRKRSEDEEPAREEPTSLAAAVADRPLNGIAHRGVGSSSSSAAGGLPPLQAAVQWCREASVWEQMVVQLRALKVPFSEEWRLPSAREPAAAPAALACQKLGAPQRQRVLRLPCPPALTSLEAWAAEQREAATAGGGDTALAGASPAPGSVIQPQISLQMDSCGLDAGAWTASVASCYLSQLPSLFSRYRLHLALPADSSSMAAAAEACWGGGGSRASGSGVQLTPQGMAMRYEQCRGESALTAVADVLGLLRLHICVTRLTSLMLAHPLGPQRESQASGRGGAPCLQPAAGGNGALAGAKSAGLAAADPIDPMWVQLDSLDGDFTGAGSANGFYFEPLPGSGDRGGSSGAAAPSNGSLEDILLSEPEPAPAADGAAATAADGGGEVAAGGAGTKPKLPLLWTLPLCGSVALTEVGLAHAVLEVTPSLPADLQRQQAEAAAAGSLSGIKTEPDAAHGAAAAASPFRVTVQWVGRHSGLAPAATPAAEGAGGPGAGTRDVAGLVRCQLSAEPPLPALLLKGLEAQLEAGCEGEFLDSLCVATAPAAALTRALAPAGLQATGLLPGAVALAPAASRGGRSALRLALRAQHEGRSLQLQLEFSRGSYTLLRLPAPRAGQFPGWVEAAWPRISSLQGCHAAPDGAAGLVQSKQAWCGLSSLGAAVHTLLQALAVGEDPAAAQQ